MRNSLAKATPETPREGVSGVFAATGETDFKLFHYNWFFHFPFAKIRSETTVS